MSVLGLLIFLFIVVPLVGSLVVFVLGTVGAVITAVASWFTRK